MGDAHARLVHALQIGGSPVQTQPSLCQLKTQQLQCAFARLPLQGLVQKLPGFVLLCNTMQMQNLLLPDPMFGLLLLQRLPLFFLRVQHGLQALVLLLNLLLMHVDPLQDGPGQHHPHHPASQGCGPAMTPSALSFQRRVIEQIHGVFHSQALKARPDATKRDPASDFMAC